MKKELVTTVMMIIVLVLVINVLNTQVAPQVIAWYDKETTAWVENTNMTICNITLGARVLYWNTTEYKIKVNITDIDNNVTVTLFDWSNALNSSEIWEDGFTIVINNRTGSFKAYIGYWNGTINDSFNATGFHLDDGTLTLTFYACPSDDTSKIYASKQLEIEVDVPENTGQNL